MGEANAEAETAASRILSASFPAVSLKPLAPLVRAAEAAEEEEAAADPVCGSGSGCCCCCCCPGCCEKTHNLSFRVFPYACSEPVLVKKMMVLSIKWHRKRCVVSSYLPQAHDLCLRALELILGRLRLCKLLLCAPPHLIRLIAMLAKSSYSLSLPHQNKKTQRSSL